MKKSIFKTMAILFILVILVTGCKSMHRTGEKSYLRNDHMNMHQDINESENIENSETTNQSKTNEKIPDNARKLIKTVGLNIDTKEFNKLVDNVYELVNSSGGYIENANIYGSETAYSMRSGEFKIRVPKQKLNDFISSVVKQGNVTNKTETTQDVTLNYVDIESKKKALLTEQESLLRLLEKAEKIEDVIAIEQRLSQVRGNVESLESQLKTYDNLVDYSTLNLSIYEVERIYKADDSIFGKMKIGFLESINDIKNGSANFLVWFVSNILYLIFIAAMVTVAIVLIKKSTKKQNKNIK